MLTIMFVWYQELMHDKGELLLRVQSLRQVSYDHQACLFDTNCKHKCQTTATRQPHMFDSKLMMAVNA